MRPVLSKPNIFIPFGRTSSTGSLNSNRFQYTGRENDEATGLYYYRTRYYSSQSQRFLAEDSLDLSEIILLRQARPNDANVRSLFSDSLTDPRLLHPSVYVVNSPVQYADPTGEWVRQVVGCLVGAGVSIGIDVMGGRKIDWFDAAVGCGLGALEGAGWATGWELNVGKNLRFAPFGNRTGHPFGRWPHYHRRIVDSNRDTIPGGSMKWHRPWEKGF